jgi:hypothetical protein
MWMMTKDGFFSTVQKPGQTDEVTVRSRVKQDLLNLLDRLNHEAEILEGAGTDYPYRIVVKKMVWVDYVSRMAENLDYENFKNTVPEDDQKRHDCYFGVWRELLRLEA